MTGIHLSFTTHANVNVYNAACDGEESQKWNNIFVKDENQLEKCLPDSETGSMDINHKRKAWNNNIQLP